MRKPKVPPMRLVDATAPVGVDTVTLSLGQEVFRKILPEVRGIVTGILFRPSGTLFLCVWADQMGESSHFAIELLTDKAFDS